MDGERNSHKDERKVDHYYVVRTGAGHMLPNPLLIIFLKIGAKH